MRAASPGRSFHHRVGLAASPRGTTTAATPTSSTPFGPSATGLPTTGSPGYGTVLGS
ncbi:hypothetical protein [Streptomyces himalayensis]|uniref:Uncharacterized protein n=1 Tax=Streptomyces himalayensis subsp. himalayensis TaxID=2756131 RepID=A0A7W0DHS7_9ACTN|nr:hypothetical protein [Streptomyces himalayensis]MBA2945220.1 hypothetical protein [Streptomyces himalayensis subsp. himalayensis]